MQDETPDTARWELPPRPRPFERVPREDPPEPDADPDPDENGEEEEDDDAS